MPLSARTFSITITGAAAVLLWTLGLALALGDWFGWVSDGAGLVGVSAVGGGHLLCMCSLFDRQHERERNAFELGRDVHLLRR